MTLKAIIFFSRFKKNKTLLNGGLFSIYSFINQGASFLLLIVLAKYILPEDYGRLSLFNTVVLFLGYFMALSSTGYISVSFFKNDYTEFKKDFTAIMVLSIGTLIFLSLVSFIMVNVEIDFGFPSIYLFYALIISFCKMIGDIFLDYLRIQEKVKSYGVLSCSNAALNFVLSLLLVVLLKEGWVGRINAQLVCYILFCILSVAYFIKSSLFSFNITKQRIMKVALWGIPLIPHVTSIWIRQGGDRYIINYYHSTYDVGLFSFALNLASVIIMIGAAFNQTNSVSIYQILSDDKIVDKRYTLRRQTKTILMINIFSAIAIYFLICLAIPFLMPNYRGSISYFIFLGIYGFIQCVYFLYCNYLFYYNKTQILMLITFGSSVFHLLLSLFLTQFSLYITCIIYILTQLLITILVYRESQKLLSNNLKLK